MLQGTGKTTGSKKTALITLSSVEWILYVAEGQSRGNK